jgi:transposase
MRRARRVGGKKVSIIGVLTVDGLAHTTAVEGNVTKGLFITYLMEDLLPFLLPGSVLVMDRLSVHCSEEVRHLIHAAGCKLMLLPPYSPELNPIEEAWSKFKNLLRRLSARSLSGLLAGVASLTGKITAGDARAWIAHAGYVSI